MNINSAKNAIAKKYKISVNSLNALLSTTVANNANNDTKKDIVLRAIQIIKSTKNETVNIKNLSELESWIADPNIKKFNTAIKPILEKIFNIPEIVLFLNESTSNNNIATFGASKNEGFEVARVPPGAVNKQVFYKILLPFTEPPKKELDIFMLGVTGSGKTTLVDSLYQYVTNVKIDRKIGGVFRAQKVSVFKPVFNVFMDNQNKTRILISENYSERDTTYDNYVKNFIRPTPFNPESSRAHVVYTLPPMRGGNTLLKGPLGKGVSTLNIVDLCGNESPIAMSMACFGMNIFEHMGTPVSYLQTISGTKILTGLNDLTQYIIKPFNKRKQSDEDKIVKNVLNDLKKIPDDRIKTMFNQIKPETIFEIFVMINLCKFIKAKPDDEFTRMMQTPNAKIARLNPPDVVKKFIADTPQIKEYSVAKYMFEMSKRCFEGLYITRSLEELKTVFNPRDFASVKNIVNKNDATLEILKNMNEKNNFKGYSIALNNLKKQINVSKTLVINSIESTKLSEVFRSKKSKKFLFAVVNPKRGNMNKHKKTINVIRRIKNIKKNISK